MVYVIQPSVNWHWFRRGENISLIRTESQYVFRRWMKFPIPLPLHFNLSPDQLATSVVACNPCDRCHCLPQYEVLDQHRRYRAGIITYWTWIVREYEVTCIPASQTIFSPNGYPACACLFTINITRYIDHFWLWLNWGSHQNLYVYPRTLQAKKIWN